MARNGFCFRCKQEREISQAREVTMKNGAPATEGVCPVCGVRLFLMGPPMAQRVDEPRPALVGSGPSTVRSHGDDDDTTDPRPP